MRGKRQFTEEKSKNLESGRLHKNMCKMMQAELEVTVIFRSSMGVRQMELIEYEYIERMACFRD